MDLSTDGTSLPLRQGRLTLRVSHISQENSENQVTLRVENSDSFESVEVTLKLGPWSPDSYDVHDWGIANVLIVSGAGRIVAVGLRAPHLLAAMGLEYEEAETLDRPWITDAESEALIIATERRVWCVDASPSIRWCWNARIGPDDCFIYAPPQADAAWVSVPVRSRRGDVVTRLRMRDGGLGRH